VVEERRTRDATVVDALDGRAGVAGELFDVAVPRRPARVVGVDQCRRVARLDG